MAGPGSVGSAHIQVCAAPSRQGSKMEFDQNTASLLLGRVPNLGGEHVNRPVPPYKLVAPNILTRLSTRLMFGR